MAESKKHFSAFIQEEIDITGEWENMVVSGTIDYRLGIHKKYADKIRTIIESKQSPTFTLSSDIQSTLYSFLDTTRWIATESCSFSPLTVENFCQELSEALANPSSSQAPQVDRESSYDKENVTWMSFKTIEEFINFYNLKKWHKIIWEGEKFQIIAIGWGKITIARKWKQVTIDTIDQLKNIRVLREKK